MTPIMTPRRRRLLIPIIHLITRIYLAYRLCTNHVCPPFAFRITVSIKVVPCLCHHCSSTITFTCEPFDKPKVLYHQVTFPTPPYTVGLFDCTLYIMYHQNCRFCLICTNTSYVTPDFHTIPTPVLFLIFHSTLGCVGRSLW